MTKLREKIDGVKTNNYTRSDDEYDCLPDVRDGLTRKERIVLTCLMQTQKERGGRNVPTLMLYGRVIEQIDMSQSEFQLILQKLTGHYLPD